MNESRVTVEKCKNECQTRTLDGERLTWDIIEVEHMALSDPERVVV